MSRGDGKTLGPWFRTYVSILDDPKLARLSDAQYRGWHKMVALAKFHGGTIPSSPEDIAFRLRMPIGKARDLLQVLVSATLFDYDCNGYTPHNWKLRQFESDVSTDRVRRFRNRSETKNETFQETPEKRFISVSETAPDTDTDTDTDTGIPKPKGFGGAHAANEDSPPSWWPKRDSWGRIAGDIDEKIMFDVGKAVLGAKAGGQVTKLRKCYGGDMRAVTDLLCQAQAKSDPGAWIAGVLKRAENGQRDPSNHEVYPEDAYRA